MTLLSTAADGTQANQHSSQAAFSPDGAGIAFVSRASNLVPGDANGFEDIFVLTLPPMRVEAEHFQLVRGFAIGTDAQASGDAFILATGGGAQVARHAFTGASGYYDLAIGHYDENDGTAEMAVFVNGLRLDQRRWDQDLGSDFVSAGNRVERAIEDVALRPGDVIELRGARDGSEPARTDYVDFLRVDDLVS